MVKQAQTLFAQENAIKIEMSHLEHPHLPSTALASEAAFTCESHGLIYGHVGQYQAHVLLPDETILVKIIDIESELDLSLNIGVVDLEEAVNELLQIDVPVPVQVKDGKESLADDTRELRIL